ncbi:LexA family transcriptional regulator [Azoarcus sp. L1K30]|nr:LexA family transcriptional regulator [Azoarcus sp. L1K30]
MKFHERDVSASLTNVASAALGDMFSATLFNRGMTNDEVRRENLGILIDLAGGVGKFASLLGVSGSQVSQWKNASPDSKTGKPRSMQDATARRIETIFHKPRGWMDQQHGTLLAEAHETLNSPSDDEYALIAQYTAKGACGAAHHNGHVEVRGGLAFKRDWLARMGLRPQDLSVIAACGESMSPTIQSDEVLLVDHSQVLPVDGKVFALERDDELVVKRLVRDFSGSWIVRSDNPDKARYGDFPVSDSDLRIVGRVVWRGGGL